MRRVVRRGKIFEYFLLGGSTRLGYDVGNICCWGGKAGAINSEGRGLNWALELMSQIRGGSFQGVARICLQTHTHTYTYTYIYIYIHLCLWPIWLRFSLSRRP